MARQLNGIVTSDKPDKSIVISVRIRATHPIYKKQYTVNTKFMAHDETNLAKVGDLVVIAETTPQSARKRFKLERIIERGGVRFEETDATADIPQEKTVEVVEQPKAKKTAVKKESEEKK
jgi:small subunit ribosomal protein S17